MQCSVVVVVVAMCVRRLHCACVQLSERDTAPNVLVLAVVAWFGSLMRNLQPLYSHIHTHTHLAVCRPVVSASQSVKAYPAERSVCAAWSAASYEIKYNTPGHWHAHHDAAAAVLRMFARRGDSLARTQTLNG